jgi:hypothetical protein
VRRGIVLATGGFGGSVDRLNDYVRPPLSHAVAFAGAAGDGLIVPIRVLKPEAAVVSAAFETAPAQARISPRQSERNGLAGQCRGA